MKNKKFIYRATGTKKRFRSLDHVLNYTYKQAKKTKKKNR